MKKNSVDKKSLQPYLQNKIKYKYFPYKTMAFK